MRLVFADRGIHDPHTTNGVQMVCLNPLASIYDRRHVCHQSFAPVAPTNLTADRINLLFWMNELSGLSREYQYQFAGSYTIVCTSNMEVPSTKQNGSQCFAEKLLTCSESLRPGAERKYMEEVLCSLSLAYLKPWYWSRSFIRDVNGNTWTDVSLSGGFVA